MKNSVASMIALVVGYQRQKQGDIHLFTFFLDIHMGNSANLKYIKLNHVVKVLLTVAVLTQNLSARSSMFNPSRYRTITMKNCSSRSNLHFRPGFCLVQSHTRVLLPCQVRILEAELNKKL